MSFADYSLTPDANGTIAGINIGENCPPGNVNDAIRQLAADGKELSNQVGGGGNSMPKAGGAFEGDISRQGRGGYLHFASASFTDGRVHLLAEGATLPASPAEGTVVLFYA